MYKIIHISFNVLLLVIAFTYAWLLLLLIHFILLYRCDHFVYEWAYYDPFMIYELRNVSPYDDEIVIADV